MQFLKDLQNAVHLPLSIRDLFDTVIGVDVGAFFGYTVFSQSWALDDCKYHLSRVTRLTGDTKRGSVSFGKGLEWELDGMAGPPTILQLKGQAFRNILTTEADLRSSCSMLVEFTRSYTPVHVRDFADQMIANLFYLELATDPRLTQPVMVRARCRLQSGPGLLSLVMGLHLREAKARIRAAPSSYQEETFVSASALGRCRDGFDFLRTFQVEIHSLDSEIDVQIEVRQGSMISLSKCPYVVSDLVRDQGIDCVFGRDDNRLPLELTNMNDFTIEDIGVLQKEIDDLIRHWSMLVVV
jgi:hypothetical protein